MALPVRSLPTVQNWDCHGCTDCCREYRVRVTDEERARIDAQGWDEVAEMQGVRRFRPYGPPWRKGWWLDQRADGACVFLNESGGCRIHAKFGADAKPLACRIYPFVLVPAGDHWRVGLRYGCPSAAADRGRPFEEHLPAVRNYAARLELQEGVTPERMPPPPHHPGQPLTWPDLLRVVNALAGVVERDDKPLERRLREGLALVRFCRTAKFDKLTGSRLNEFLNLIGTTLDAEVLPAEEVPSPGWLGRVIFRQVMAVYSRKDAGERKRKAGYGRIGLLRAAARFARGTGRVPRLNADLPEVRFEEIERPAGPIPSGIERRLTEYYRMKLRSLQFCGRPNFGLSIWDGFASLALTLPAICWLARAFHDRDRETAFTLALRTVDDNFGFNPLLGERRQRFGVGVLAGRGELDRLVAWYSR